MSAVSQNWAEYGPSHMSSLRKMIVDMAFEQPLVILIKLADRLHNMRTVRFASAASRGMVCQVTYAHCGSIGPRCEYASEIVCLIASYVGGWLDFVFAESV